ncbi:MAG: dTDP-4-dehydrorhamnose 3,5-epimerase [Bacilli bacterium]|nr:dTDP-4-dehydrorhamnose 3,5-epimerase [Bacilli bacterium]
MKKIATELNDCYIIEPSVFGDNRGYFSPYFIQKDFDELGFERVVQTNRSKSGKGVLRGLHFQKEPMTQAKIVEVISGAAIDVVVDMRVESSTYGKSTAVLLTPYDKDKENSGRQLFVPRGFAHGFLSLEDNTVFQYLIDNDYAPSHEGGIFWNDPDLGIDWEGMMKKYDIKEPLLSEKDQVHPLLKDSPIYFKK